MISQFEVIVLSSLILNKMEDYEFEEDVEGQRETIFRKVGEVLPKTRRKTTTMETPRS